jgi:hypothetical protein
MTIKKDLIIIVSGYNNKTGDNFTNDLKNYIDKLITGVSTLDAVGYYNGTFEQSIVCTCQTMAQVQEIALTAFIHYNQSSVLIRDTDDTVYFVYSDLSEECSNKTLKQVSMGKAIQAKGYTLVNNNYWILG